MLVLFATLFCMASAIYEPAPPNHKDLIGNARWMVSSLHIHYIHTLPDCPEGQAYQAVGIFWDSHDLNNVLPMPSGEVHECVSDDH